jgi:hypothetical protein
LHGINPRGSKSARFRPHLEKILQGRVKLPQDCEFGPAFVAELVDFPHGRHTDQADAFSQAMAWIEEYGQDAEPSDSGGSPADMIAVRHNSEFRHGHFTGYIGKPTDPGLIAIGRPSRSWRY